MYLAAELYCYYPSCSLHVQYTIILESIFDCRLSLTFVHGEIVHQMSLFILFQMYYMVAKQLQDIASMAKPSFCHLRSHTATSLKKCQDQVSLTSKEMTMTLDIAFDWVGIHQHKEHI